MVSSWLFYIVVTPLVFYVVVNVKRLWRSFSRVKQTRSEWPTTVQELIDVDQCEVWEWLRDSFKDYHVMLKVPLIRYALFTTHQKKYVPAHVLASLHCDFTICDASGAVIGCVDVFNFLNGQKRLDVLKRSILEGCGIPYVQVEQGQLPSEQYIRAEFIGHIRLHALGAPAFSSDDPDRALHSLNHPSTRPFLSSV